MGMKDKTHLAAVAVVNAAQLMGEVYLILFQELMLAIQRRAQAVAQRYA